MKNSLLLVSLAVATMATAATGLRHTLKATSAIDAKVESLAPTKALRAADDGDVKVLVQEDFSKFTAGSPDNPDGTELSDWSTGTIDAKYTNQPGWRGGFVYQAGGCAYLDIDTEEGTGWLITPVTDMSNYGGTFTISLRVRIGASKADATDDVYVQSCSRGEYSNTVISSEIVKGTTEWKEYTLTFTDGNATSNVQITAMNYPLFVDDITITQTDNGKPGTPVALEATNATDNSFTANWQEVNKADGYLLSVFTLYRETPQYVFKDKPVTGTSYDVTGIEPETDYYYTVTATRGDQVSGESNVIFVARQLKTPVTLEATDVDNDGFTANWQAVTNATAYAVYTDLTHTAKADESFDLFKSDFSAVQAGSIDQPLDYSRLGMRVYLDDLAPRCDWKAYIPMAAAGMFGVSNMFLDYGVNGTIYSPSLDLSHNDGKCTLRFHALARKGATKLRIRLLSDDMDLGKGLTVERYTTECEVGEDLKEYTIELNNGYYNSWIEISIPDSKGYVLFDDLQFSQELKAGESTTLGYNYQETEETSLRVLTPDYAAGDVYYYSLFAYRLDSEGNLISGTVSELSDSQEVKHTDSVGAVAADALTVAATDGGFSVSLNEAARVEVYSLDGSLVYSGEGLHHEIAAPQHGVYVVRAAGRAVKAVR